MERRTVNLGKAAECAGAVRAVAGPLLDHYAPQDTLMGLALLLVSCARERGASAGAAAQLVEHAEALVKHSPKRPI